MTEASSSTAPLISVLVVNHNRASLLRECVPSVLGQTWPNLEALVLDNGSVDDSAQVAADLAEARLRFVPLGANLGFGAANNVGIALAKGEFVALLNNDAVASPTWLENLVKPALESSRVGMCASKILFFNSRIIDKAGHLLYWDGQNRGRGTGEVDQGQYDRAEEAFFPDGCAALYRRTMLDEIGGFDEDFFAYADDADLGIRGRLAGWECRYAPDAVVHHRHSSTSGPYSSQKIYWVERNRLWLAVKTFPLWLLVLSPLFTATRWTWNLAAALLGRGAAGNFRRESSLLELVRTLWRAYRDGVRRADLMWRKRRSLDKIRKLSNRQFCSLLIRYRISARRLAFQDVQRI